MRGYIETVTYFILVSVRTKSPEVLDTTALRGGSFVQPLIIRLLVTPGVQAALLMTVGPKLCTPLWSQMKTWPAEKSAGVRLLIACCRVDNGAARVPGLASLPPLETCRLVLAAKQDQTGGKNRKILSQRSFMIKLSLI